MKPLALNYIALPWKHLSFMRTTVKVYPRLWIIGLLVERNSYDSFTTW
jgi:hypothetical protein